MPEGPPVAIPAINVSPSERVPNSNPVTTNGLPLDVIVEVGSERRSHSIPNLEDDNIEDKFGEIAKIKQDLATEYGPFAEHQCRIEFVTTGGTYSERCNGARGFYDCLQDYRDLRGQHLCFIADYSNGSRPNQPETAQQLTKRLLEERISKNVEMRECLPLPAIRSVLFESHNMFHHLRLQDDDLQKQLIRHPDLFEIIRKRGSKLLALMVLAGVDPFGGIYIDFLDDGLDDYSIPLYLRQRPHFCNEDTWGSLTRHEQPLIVAELTPLKEIPRLLDFEITQPLPFKSMKGVKEGGYAEVFEVLLLDDHPELYRLVWVRYRNGRLDEDRN
jgi:hypothetical protein